MYLLSLVPGPGGEERPQEDIRKDQEDIIMIHKAGFGIRWHFALLLFHMGRFK